MSTATVLRDATLGVGAGIVGTKAKSRVKAELYARENQASKRQEQDVSYGASYEVAAENLALALLGVQLDQDQRKKSGSMLQYAVGVSWTPLYVWLRRSGGRKPVGAVTTTGACMFVVLDELISPLLGFAASPDKYPVVTHLRRVAGHLAYATAAAATMESGWRLLSSPR